MSPERSGPIRRIVRGLGVLAERGMGRSSLLAAAAAPFFAARSPGAALLFVLFPAYAVLARGDFSASKEENASDAALLPVEPGEILARLAAASLGGLVSMAASSIGLLLARRFSLGVFDSPWGLGIAGIAASFALAAVHLPALAAKSRAAGRTAAGIFFAATGILAAVSALRAKSMYTTFLWLLYSGRAPGLFAPLLGIGAALAGLSGTASWLMARKADRKRPLS